MKQDNQIIYPKCIKCNKCPEPGRLIMRINNFYICGDCFIKQKKKRDKEEKKYWLEE